MTGLRGVLAFVTGLCLKFAWCDGFVTGFQRFVRAFAAGESEPVTRLHGVRQSQFWRMTRANAVLAISLSYGRLGGDRVGGSI